MAAKKSAVAKSAAKTAKGPRSSSRSERQPSKKAGAGEKLVTIDRRRRARREDEASAQTPVPAEPAAALERRKKVQRRRQIDPTTCERDYSIEEVEFMNAMDDYKRKSGRMFPTCSEVLEVIRDLGYVKLSPAGLALLAVEETLAERLDAVTKTVERLVEGQ